MELDPGLVEAALRPPRLGIAAERTWSGAGHDAQHLSAFAPALLVFVPLHDGESHTPHEGADLEEIVGGRAGVVAEVMRRLPA